MSQLVLCLGCARHVRVDDPSCPFCAGTARGRAPEPRRVAGLGRAALMALGASVAACGPGDTTIEVVTPSEPVEAVAPSEPVEAIAPRQPVEATAPSEPSEAVEPVEPSEPSEPVEPSETTTPRPPRTHAPARDLGAPAPAYGAAPVPRRPREEENGGNVPLYGGPGLED